MTGLSSPQETTGRSAPAGVRIAFIALALLIPCQVAARATIGEVYPGLYGPNFASTMHHDFHSDDLVLKVIDAHGAALQFGPGALLERATRNRPAQRTLANIHSLERRDTQAWLCHKFRRWGVEHPAALEFARRHFVDPSGAEGPHIVGQDNPTRVRLRCE